MNATLVCMLPVLVAIPAQQPQYRIDVQAVQVDVFATRDGRAILGLGKDDFALHDNGVLQEIDVIDFRREPMTVALVLDVSDSVAGATLKRLKSAANVFIRGLDPADRVTLVTFSHYVHRRAPLTNDFAAVRDEIDGLLAGGGTAWHDALFLGLELLEGSARQPLVVLFTDGEDTYSWLRGDQVSALVMESSAIVYSIGTVSATERIRGLTVSWDRLLERVSRMSGGRFIEAESTSELEASFERVLSEMRSRYVLSYQPRGVERDGWHDIDVELRHRDGDVRARRGYFYRAKDSE